MILENAKQLLLNIDSFFPLQADLIQKPTRYLGAEITEVTLPNGVRAWAQGSNQYINEAVWNVETWLSEKGKRGLQQCAPTPMSYGYRPELDVSPELSPDNASYFQSLISILRWAVEFGQVNITTEVSMLSSHLALPCEGHLHELFHIFAYLKKKSNS